MIVPIKQTTLVEGSMKQIQTTLTIHHRESLQWIRIAEIELLTGHSSSPFRNAACKAVAEVYACKHGEKKLSAN